MTILDMTGISFEASNLTRLTYGMFILLGNVADGNHKKSRLQHQLHAFQEPIAGQPIAQPPIR